MKVKHFVPIRPYVPENGPAACNKKWYALGDCGEVAKTRKQVTCKNCQKTKVFRKIK